MTRFKATSTTALLLLAASVSFSAAQISGGSSSGGASSSGASGGAGSSVGGSSVGGGSSSGLSSTTSAPAVQPVPRPATDPNNQVAPSAVGLPGGASSIPQTSGSGIGTSVPTYGTQNSSGIGGSINESSQRSSNTDCTGTGTRSSTGSGSTSTTTSNCSSTSSGGLGTRSITGSGSAIDVTR
jgi:hypothetical protein